MLRRLVILLLLAMLPLQVFASVHMGLSVAHRQMTMAQMIVQTDTPSAVHDHATSVEHAHHAAQVHHSCSTCDLCMPPLAVEIHWPPLSMAAVVVPAAPVADASVIPSSHDRPPRA